MTITPDTMSVLICRNASCTAWFGGYEFLEDGTLIYDGDPETDLTYGFREDYPLSIFIYSEHGYYYENWMKVSDLTL